MRIAVLSAFLFLPGLLSAQTNPAPAQTASTVPAPKPAAAPRDTASSSSSNKTSRAAATAAQMQASLDQLTQSNHDLLDLLKRQQAVLQDMQFDRRLQSRQIQSLEERLEDSLLQNAQLQKSIDNLEANATRPAAPAPANSPVTVNGAPAATNANPSAPPTPVAAAPPPPSTYLPAPESAGAPGTKSWQRLFTLKGEDGRQTDLFTVQGRTWRVLWHNQDKLGKAYQNTSALFINAFPKDDTIPQKVCSKLGSGGDATELVGPGHYYLKIEASGGAWELAVEDFR